MRHDILRIAKQRPNWISHGVAAATGSTMVCPGDGGGWLTAHWDTNKIVRLVDRAAWRARRHRASVGGLLRKIVPSPPAPSSSQGALQQGGF